MRIVGIWISGLLASLIIGGLVGGKLGPGWGSDYELWGAIAGALVFCCARLLLAGKRPEDIF